MTKDYDSMKAIFEKMGGIEDEIHELKRRIYYISEDMLKRDSLDDWRYDEGTDEKALLNNIKHPEKEAIGKIYYIQAYCNGTVTQNVPYMVIDINHEYGATGTVDLMSKVAADYMKWSNSLDSWKYGKYTTSNIYNWLLIVCPNGYSDAIQSKMITMTERWREATGNDTGTVMSRRTNCKLLNPVELFGSYSSAAYVPQWRHANWSDHRTKFLSDNYGTQYPAWTNTTGADTNRRVFSDIDMCTRTYYWTNSWLAFIASDGHADCFGVYNDGHCGDHDVDVDGGVAPVIRLAD